MMRSLSMLGFGSAGRAGSAALAERAGWARWFAAAFLLAVVLPVAGQQPEKDQSSDKKQKPAAERPSERDKDKAADQDEKDQQSGETEIDDALIRRLAQEALRRQAERASGSAGERNRRRADSTARSEPMRVKLSGNDVSVEVLDTGEIVLFGNESDLQTLEEFILLLDQEPPEKESVLHVLQTASAQDVAQKLQEAVELLWPASVNLPDEKISVIAVASSVLLIIGPPDRLDRVIEIAEAIDQVEEPIPEFQTMKFYIKNRKASEVVEQLEKIITKLNQKRSDSKDVTLEANDADNSIMVFGPETLRRQIESLIEQIDVEPVEGFGHLKLVIFPLVNGDAEDLATVLTDMLQSDSGQKEVKEAIRRLSVLKKEADGTLRELPPLNLDAPLRVLSDKTTNSLIVATIEANIDPLNQIVKLLDGVPLGHEMKLKIFPLRFADAETVQEVLKTMFEEGKTLPERAPGGTKTEAVPDGALGRALVYNVGLTIDKRSNILFVSGRPEQLALAQLVVDEIDKPVSSVKFPLRVIFLGDRLDASRVADIIQELYDKRSELFDQTEVGNLAKAREQVFLAVDVLSNALIVSASEENYNEIEQMIVALGSASERVVDNIRLIACTNTTAADLAGKIDELWQRKSKLQREGQTDDTPVVVADQRSNTLVIASSPEDFDAIKRLVDQLESQPLSPIAGIRLIQLKNNDAEATSNMLKSLFEERAQQRLAQGQDENPADRVAVAADPATNTILVASSRENYDEMVRIVGVIDVEPDVQGVVRLYPLETAVATDVAEKIKELFDQGLYHPNAGLDSEIAKERQKIALVADARSNTIIASASRQNLSIVEKLIQKMDADMAAYLRDDTKIIALEHGDAVRVADMLEKLFESRAADAPEPDLFRMPTILADDRSNTLIISGSKDSLRRCEGLIDSLDKPSSEPTSVFEVYTLQYGSAVKLAEKMQDLFDKRAEGREDSAGTPINIQADETSNSLIASASRDDHLLIVGLLELLDKPSSISKQFQIFPLHQAKAETVAETLDQLFQQQGDSSSGRADATAVQADVRSNSLVVWASPSEMENVGEIIRQLDTAKPVTEMMVKVIRLRQALAEDFAQILQDTLMGDNQQTDNAVILSFVQKDDEGNETVRKLLRQDITITPDPRSNSLMVMAPAESMDLLESMIVEFDQVKPVTAEIRMFPLANADADDVVERLNDIFGIEDGGSSDEIESTLVFGEGAAAAPTAGATGVEGGSPRLKLRFTSDRRTNTVIAAGNPIDLVMAEQLVRELDALEVEQRMLQVYTPRTIPAVDLASSLADFVESENNLLSELDDAVSIRKRADKQVTVVSDEESNSVILGMSERNYSNYMDLIQQIDKPEPQVMISLLVAEVSLDDRHELGVEFAAQDLNFSERAFTGPNGVIQGDQFDVVVGTDIGAAGVGFGGLSLTVSGEDFSFLFHALQTQGQIEVLSRPTLLVQNNAEGNITIGDRVPIITGQTSAGGQSSTSIQYEEVGIILQVTPHINPDGYVNLEINPEISGISNQSLQVAEGLNAAVFTERSAETTVTVKDGETVILGGLITENIQDAVNTVPLLSDIPLLGELFKSTVKTATKTELLIVLTVNVIRNENELREVSERERDRTGRLPERIRRHPLMEGLRIRPDRELLGPSDDEAVESDSESIRIRVPGGPDSSGKPRIYGPVPDRYGPKRPTVSSGAATDTWSSRPRVYGPKLVKSKP